MATFPLKITSVSLTEEVLGKGSFGEVIEVEWCGTTCAAKRMHDIFLKILSADELDKMVKDFEKECQIWSTLRHPNVVQFFGTYYPKDSRLPIFVIEKMNMSLRHYLEKKNKEKFLLVDKVFILRQVAQGLCYLHSSHPPLVHHDLSPNNVLLNNQTFQAKLTDFGMTRAINPTKLTRTHSSIKGTQVFMSPEALCSPPKYTEKLDIFSFGNCLTTIVTHEWPSVSEPTHFVDDELVARSELERRQSQIDLMDDAEKKLFMPLIKECLANRPKQRPDGLKLVLEMKRIEDMLRESAQDMSSPIIEPSVSPRANDKTQLLEGEVAEKDVQVAGLKKVIAQQEERIAQQKEHIAQQEDHIAQQVEDFAKEKEKLEKQLEGKQTVIKSLSDEIADQKKIFEIFERQIRISDAEVARLQSKLKQVEKDLQEERLKHDTPGHEDDDEAVS